MYVSDKMRGDWQRSYGKPVILPVRHEISSEEYAMVKDSQKGGRAHDITFFIFKNEKIALIKKHFFPPGAYRAPSGGLLPDESLEAGTDREAFEETGLKIKLETYWLSVKAEFFCAAQKIDWTTDVFSARATGGTLRVHDTEEIAEVRWGTVEELQGPIRQTLLNTGRSLFRYRVMLTDATVRLLAAQNTH